MTLVSILTPTIAGRERFLEECKASVRAQVSDNVTSWEHLIETDIDRLGCAVTMNKAAARAQSDWLLPLADDDLLLPGCLRSLLSHASDGDIIYAPPCLNSNEDRAWFFQAPPVLPSFALIRRDLWNELGGYDEGLRYEEDRALWIKAMAAGAKFVRVDEPCWVYRQWTKADGTPGNKSFAKATA